jgi:RNA polymerase sigma-70 factor (ECF subfamily)
MLDTHQGKQSTWQGHEPADGVLVGQALAGDERAFEVLVSRYQHALLHYIQRILKNDELANDVLQFVLLQLYFSLPTLRRDVPLKRWLLQVAHHRCLDEIRKQRARPALHFSELSWDVEQALTESIKDPHPMPEEIVEQGDLHATLQQAIGKLPPGLRSIVALRFFGDLSFKEIGQVLNMPTCTARTYCYRSLQQLRSILTNSSSLVGRSAI